MRLRLSRAEWIALAIGLAIAGGFFAHQWRYPSSLYDAGQYAQMGRNILEHGLRSRFMESSQVRTYGYPVFVSAIVLAARTLHVPFVLVLFLVQLAAYVLAAMALRRSLAPSSPTAARVVFCGLLLNYYGLLYTPECLTESLSLSAAILLGAGWLTAYRRRGPLWLVAGLAWLAGVSVMIRPANLSTAAASIVGTILIGVRSRPTARRATIATAAVAACLALPFLPQLLYNGTQFGRWTPLLARDLSRAQQAWGIQYIKYATAMPPSPQAAVFYVNPWLDGTTVDEAAPLAWYVAHPRRGALTLALHSFNLTDQDLLFTYSRDLDPWYRVPLGIVNHAAVALGLIGLAALAVGAVRSRDRAPRDAMTLVVLALAGTWALHAWAAVEMRFGAVVLCVLFPAAGYALLVLARSKSARQRIAIAVIVAAYVAGALRLSAWVRDQAPLIRAVAASRHVQPSDADVDTDGDGTPDNRDRCPAVYAATPDGCAVAAPRSGDWNGDGAAQVTFVDAAGRAYAWTLRDCARAAARDLATNGAPAWTLAGTSDLTGDGKADLLWRNPQTGDVRIFAMADAAKIGEQILTPHVAESDWRIAGTGDFDGDGAADLVWQRVSTGHAAIWFMRSAGGRAVVQRTAYVTAGSDAAVVAGAAEQIAGTTDVDADGHRDLIVENPASGVLTIARLGAPTPNGVPLLGKAAAGTAGAGWHVDAIANLAGDGRDDLVLQDESTRQLALWIRDGDRFVPSCHLDSPPAGWQLAGPR
jgi:hypothetical protein